MYRRKKSTKVRKTATATITSSRIASSRSHRSHVHTTPFSNLQSIPEHLINSGVPQFYPHPSAASAPAPSIVSATVPSATPTDAPVVEPSYAPYAIQPTMVYPTQGYENVNSSMSHFRASPNNLQQFNQGPV